MAEIKKLIDKDGLSYYHQNTVAPMINATYDLGQSLLSMQENFNSAEFWEGVVDVDTRVITGSVATKKDLPSSNVSAGTYYITTKQLLTDENNIEHEVKGVVFDYYELPNEATDGDVYQVTSPVEAYYVRSEGAWNALTGTAVPAGTIYVYDGQTWKVEDDTSNMVDLSSYARKEELSAFEGEIKTVSLAEAESWFTD